MKYILEYDMVNGLATSVDLYTGNDRVGVEYESDEPYGEPGQYRYQIFNSKEDIIDFIEDMRIDDSMVDNLYEKTNRGKTMERQRRNKRVEGKKFIIAEGQILKTTCGSYVESTGTEEFIVEACGRKSFKRPMGRKGLDLGDEAVYASPMKRGMEYEVDSETEVEDDMKKDAMKRRAMRKKMAMRKRAMGRKGIGFSQDYSEDEARMVSMADPR